MPAPAGGWALRAVARMTRGPSVGGIVLCGGQSSRMGQPKALLPFGPECLLQRVVRLVRACVEPIVVVAASAKQPLPPLPIDTLLAYDRRPERGPLEGLLAGLEQLAPHAAAAYVTSCDVPLLSPAFIAHMISQLTEDVDVVVPVEEQRFHHPLAAVYRTSVAPIVADLLNHDQLRPVFLYDRVRTLRIDAQQLRAVDPELHSLMNVNHWDDYQHALGIYHRTMQEE